MDSRTIATSTISGVFSYPLGITFMHREGVDYPRTVVVSTVCLEGAHLEDPLQIVQAESGFETLVFLDGITFFSVFTATYATRDEAQAGHACVVERLLKGELPLAIALRYHAHEDVSAPKLLEVA